MGGDDFETFFFGILKIILRHFERFLGGQHFQGFQGRHHFEAFWGILKQFVGILSNFKEGSIFRIWSRLYRVLTHLMRLLDIF